MLMLVGAASVSVMCFQLPCMHIINANNLLQVTVICVSQGNMFVFPEILLILIPYCIHNLKLHGLGYK